MDTSWEGACSWLLKIQKYGACWKGEALKAFIATLKGGCDQLEGRKYAEAYKWCQSFGEVSPWWVY